MEQKFILILNTQVPHGYGYNVTIGGDGCLGCQYSEATKDRISKQMSARMKGNKYTLGHPLSAEHKLKISIANKGKKNALGCRRSDETKRKMSLALKGKIVSRETGLKISLAKTGQKKKPIILNNVEYSCIKEAARLLNTNYSTLRDRIRRYGLTGNWPPGCGYVMKQIT